MKYFLLLFISLPLFAQEKVSKLDYVLKSNDMRILIGEGAVTTVLIPINIHTALKTDKLHLDYINEIQKNGIHSSQAKQIFKRAQSAGKYNKLAMFSFVATFSDILRRGFWGEDIRFDYIEDSQRENSPIDDKKIINKKTVKTL